MLVANQILSYKSFKYLDREDIYSLQLEDAYYFYNTTKLKNHHAKRMNEVLEYIRFIEDNGDDVLADNPSKWDIYLRKLKRNNTPNSNPIAPPTVGIITGTTTTATPTV